MDILLTYHDMALPEGAVRELRRRILKLLASSLRVKAASAKQKKQPEEENKFPGLLQDTVRSLVPPHKHPLMRRKRYRGDKICTGILQLLLPLAA